jgi:hypothetical protein
MKFVVISVNEDDENVKIFLKNVLNFKFYSIYFNHFSQIKYVAHPEH